MDAKKAAAEGRIAEPHLEAEVPLASGESPLTWADFACKFSRLPARGTLYLTPSRLIWAKWQSQLARAPAVVAISLTAVARCAVRRSIWRLFGQCLLVETVAPERLLFMPMHSGTSVRDWAKAVMELAEAASAAAQA